MAEEVNSVGATRTPLRYHIGMMNVDTQKRRNLPLWVSGFLILLGIASAALFFAPMAMALNAAWLNLAFVAAALLAAAMGLRRAVTRPNLYSRTTATVMMVLAVLSFAFAIFGNYEARHIPGAGGAPRVGQKAPDFTLPDSSHKTVSLAQLLAEPMMLTQGTAAASRAPKGVLLIFYRGYW